MKINTTLGLLAGKLSGSILEKMGRGSTLPGKVALKFDKDILSQLAKNYEIVVITGTNGKTLTTALTVGILQEAFWTYFDQSKWGQYDLWDYNDLLTG